VALPFNGDRFSMSLEIKKYPCKHRVLARVDEFGMKPIKNLNSFEIFIVGSLSNVSFKKSS